jgi:phospholipid/cholesterol/gamma-HCH transport system permease protein
MNSERRPPSVQEGALESELLLRSGVVDGRLLVSAGGSWTATHARELELLVDGLGAKASGAASLSLDMRGIDALDTFGAWLAERIVRDWRARGREAQIIGLAEHYRGLLQSVQRTNLKTGEGAAKENWLLSAPEQFGRSVVALGRDFVPFLDMLGAVVAAAGRTLLRPRLLRMTSLVHHLDRVG